jgi:hypothetical protein
VQGFESLMPIGTDDSGLCINDGCPFDLASSFHDQRISGRGLPFRGTKGTLREGGNRVPAIVCMPGKVAANAKNHEITGGLDLMATFASVGGVRLPTQDRAGQPIIFDSVDLSPVMFRHRPVAAQVVVLFLRERAVARRCACQRHAGQDEPPACFEVGHTEFSKKSQCGRRVRFKSRRQCFLPNRIA